MNIHDAGTGPPLVVVPGVQGRWEWMRPGIDRLARHYRVITFSLCDEPTSGDTFDEAGGFACYVDQITRAMDARSIARATICGVSYGGLIAAAFAARHRERTAALVLVSALSPRWRLNERARFYLRAPRLLFPLFALSSLRLSREMIRAQGAVAAGLAAAARHGWNVVTHPTSPERMAARVRLLEGLDLSGELERLNVPTLICTGEDDLDYVVPPAVTREYAALWPNARVEVLRRTGHLGIITRPEELARLLDAFMASHDAGDERRRSSG